jgi:hypothetical protein
MSVVDLPPGLGLAGAPLGEFHAPTRAKRLSTAALLLVSVFGAAAWGFAARGPYTRHTSTMVVLPVAFLACAALGFLVRRARVVVTRDGVRWGWPSLHFTQPAARIVHVHVYSDGIALQARRGSWWFIAARDWDRFDVIVRQLRRVELPIVDHAGRAPLRARLQSYGRFLDGLLVVSTLGTAAVMLWAA